MALVDAFGHSDYSLNSGVGSYDGDVYARLIKMAKESPFNATQEGPAWETTLGPFIRKQNSKQPKPKL